MRILFTFTLRTVTNSSQNIFFMSCDIKKNPFYNPFYNPFVSAEARSKTDSKNKSNNALNRRRQHSRGGYRPIGGGRSHRDLAAN